MTEEGNDSYCFYFVWCRGEKCFMDVVLSDARHSVLDRPAPPQEKEYDCQFEMTDDDPRYER